MARVPCHTAIIVVHPVVLAHLASVRVKMPLRESSAAAFPVRFTLDLEAVRKPKACEGIEA